MTVAWWRRCLSVQCRCLWLLFTLLLTQLAQLHQVVRVVAAVADPSPVVKLNDGSPVVGQKLLAKNGKLVTEFWGIPFAEPPTGKLRFRKPVPKKPWRTLLHATRMPNACSQNLDRYFGDFQGAAMWNANTNVSEDCLYLNVFVPGDIDPGKKLPVMVWVYGGGFWSGCATLGVYDGKIFSSEEQVIIVSMNYRVSVFGFLYTGTEEAPGNQGLWDQLMALKWTHSHISAFGGDPDQITLFGESAGGASVSAHVLSDRSAPYFRRAIIQSGSITAPWAIKPREVARLRAVRMCQAMKCGNFTYNEPDTWDMNKVMACMLGASEKLLLENEWSPVMEFADFPWVPVIDGDLLHEQVGTSLKTGRFKHTELMAGSNMDEAIYFIVYGLQEVFNKNEFFTKTDFIKSQDTWLRSVNALLPNAFKRVSPVKTAILHEYEPYTLPVTSPKDLGLGYLREGPALESELPEQDPPEIYEKIWVDALDKMLGDLHFTCNVNEFALAHAAHGGRTYYYYFSHRATEQTWPKWMGVLHGYEINFIFGEPINTQDYSYNEEEMQLSRRFMRYWANFARTGDPNKNADGTYLADLWPMYLPSTMQYLNMTVESDYVAGADRIGSGPRRKQCAFWKKIVPTLMSAVADYGDSYVRWKHQFDKWQNEHMTDWQLAFEQYKRVQAYQRRDSRQQSCDDL